MRNEINESYNDDTDIRPHFVQCADIKYQQLWETLSESTKLEIENQATLRTLDTKNKIDAFFESRNLDIHVVNNKPFGTVAANRTHDTQLNEYDTHLAKMINYLNS